MDYIDIYFFNIFDDFFINQEKILSILNDEEIYIIKQRAKNKTYKKIGLNVYNKETKKKGICGERIRQKEAKALRKIRSIIK